MTYNRVKTLSFLVLTGILLFHQPIKSVFAQSALSPCTLTQVGKPVTSPTLPPGCSTGGNTGSGGGGLGQKPPNYPADLRQAIIDEFGITVNGFDNNSDHLKWIWEKFWDVKGTKFNSLVRGSVIQAVNLPISAQVGCPGKSATSVELNAYPYGEAFFKYIVMHELGHVIHNCNNRSTIRWNDVITAAQSEGAVSYYGAHAFACTQSDNDSENYADMVAYYLNPEAGISTAKCGGRAPAAPPNPFFASPVLRPLQLAIVKSVLD